MRYFAEHLLRQWGVFVPNNGWLWLMEPAWLRETLNELCSMYGLQNRGPTTMVNHKKIQEAVKTRDIMLPVNLLLSNVCQAVSAMFKNHRDLNWLVAHQ